MLDALAGELHLLDSSLSGGQTGDGHTEGRAGHIVQTGAVAELHGGGIAAVLAADTQMQVGVHAAAQLAGHIHQLADALLIQLGEGIILVDLLIIVSCLLYTSPSPRDA